MEFVTSKRIDKWVEKHREQGCVSRATAGEQFVYEFLPSGIVECQTVKCLCCKEEFTDYVDQELHNEVNIPKQSWRRKSNRRATR